MATEKVGVYRRWLEPVPYGKGKPIPKSEWPAKRRHSWTVRWYGTNGKRYSKDFKTRKEADRYARTLQSQVEIGRQDRPEKISLHDFMIEHGKVMRGRVAYATLYDQMRALRFFEKYIGGFVQLQRIKPSQAEGYIAHRLGEGVRVSTANKDIRTLKRVFNLAIEPRGYLRDGQNPFAKVKKRKMADKPMRYVSVPEYRALLNASPQLWWKGVVSIGYGSGLRRSEIFNLTWADIDFENQYIHIRPKDSTRQTIEWEPKDHESRVVPMSDETAKMLIDIEVAAEEGFPYIFLSQTRFQIVKRRVEAGRWNPKCDLINNVIRDFDVVRCRAGVSKCTLQDLRRSAITNWAARLPIHVVQQLAGHSDIATTRKYYLAVRHEDVISAKEVLNETLAGKSD